jgi:hypothetical protein
VQDRAAVGQGAVEAEAGVRGLAGMVIGRQGQHVGSAAGESPYAQVIAPAGLVGDGGAVRRRLTRGVEPPVGDGVPGDQRGRGPGCRSGHRVEAGEPGCEVDRQGEAVVRAGEFDVLDLRCGANGGVTGPEPG